MRERCLAHGLKCRLDSPSRRYWLIQALLAPALLSCLLVPITRSGQDVEVVEVEARRGWQDSGVRAAAGDVLTITHVAGEWSPWPGESFDALGSGGDPRCRCNVMQGVSHAALLGRIGDSSPFLVGGEYHRRVGESGPLELRINDVDLNDNSGVLKVLIEVD